MNKFNNLQVATGHFHATDQSNPQQNDLPPLGLIHVFDWPTKHCPYFCPNVQTAYDVLHSVHSHHSVVFLWPKTTISAQLDKNRVASVPALLLKKLSFSKMFLHFYVMPRNIWTKVRIFSKASLNQ